MKQSLMDQNWQDLAEAIVLTAVEDWRSSSFALQFPSTATAEMLKLFRSCERFFSSGYFELLTGLDGNTFLKRLKEGFSFA